MISSIMGNIPKTKNGRARESFTIGREGFAKIEEAIGSKAKHITKSIERN